MFNLESITAYFAAQGRLHKSQRQTLAALVWALMRQPLLGVERSAIVWPWPIPPRPNTPSNAYLT
jgi:hypothetical protein